MQATTKPSLVADRLAELVTPAGRRFVLHWGEMGSRWGMSRTVCQIHALLFLLGRPMHAEEIADTLEVARSNVSNSLRELQNWNLVRVVHQVGDRRDHYETAQDPWDLMRVIVAGRKAREFDPTVETLRRCVEDKSLGGLDGDAQKRLKDTLSLMEGVSAWADQMLALETPTLKKLIRLGARVQSLLGGKSG